VSLNLKSENPPEGPVKSQVDRSPEAVRRRLQERSQRFERWCSLRHAKVLGPIEAPTISTAETDRGALDPATAGLRTGAAKRGPLPGR
jgi:hypothetical protein